MKTYLEFRQKRIENKATCKEETTNILQEIDRNKHLQAYIKVNENAVNEAAVADKRFEAGNPGPLEGMLVAVKDNISTRSMPTTCASKMLEKYEPVFDATVVQRIKAAGGIVIGKANMDEFAMGSSNETSYFGCAKNPVDTSCVPGGSSGGSAAIVAAGLAHTALGSDTGGSVRQPASFCGVVGFKPTYGRISRYGLIAFASSLDHIGIFANNIEDTALLLDVMSGRDDMDSTSANTPNTDIFNAISASQQTNSNFKIGILPERMLQCCSHDVLEVYYEYLDKIQKSGGQLHEIEFDCYDAWVPTYVALTTAEASSNFSRLDGIRLGHRTEKNIDNIDIVSLNRGEGFGDEVKRRLLVGTYIMLSNPSLQYYAKAKQMQQLIKKCYAAAFDKVDFIFLPTTSTSAFKTNEKNSDPVSMYLSDFFTTSANLSGIPAISLPLGKSKAGLPIGMQLQANLFEEEKLFAYSKKITR